MRFTIISEHDEMKKKLVASVRQMRLSEKVEVTDFERALDTVIRTQPAIVLLGLQDERCPRSHRLVREIQEIAFGKVIVVGPALEAKALLMFLQEGVYQYIDEADFESAITVAINRLRKEQPNGFKRGQSFSGHRCRRRVRGKHAGSQPRLCSGQGESEPGLNGLESGVRRFNGAAQPSFAPFRQRFLSQRSSNG